MRTPARPELSRLRRLSEAAAWRVRLAEDDTETSAAFEEWIADPGNGQMNVKSEVNLAVLRGLRAAGVEIPYPQRVVRMVEAAER